MVPSAPISAAVVTLGELFSDANRFRLPHFQRAYAWSTGQVSRLLADLIEALRRPEEARRHFLGRLLLARPPGGDGISVIDGHQRLMTLTILFAVLRDLSADGSERIRAASCIGTGGIGAGSTERSLRLVPHAGLAAFMSGYVQADGATLVEFEGDQSGLSETETNIIVNRDYLRGQLTQAEDADRLRRDLSLFLVERCRVVVIEVEDEIEAWSMLQTEEQTRLGFNATDRAKASILSAMPAADREICGPIWEHWQSRLGAKRMRGLLAHVRTLELRRRSDVPVETELIRHFELHRGAVAFFEQRLVPRAERLVALRSSEPWPAPDRAAIVRVLETIRWVDRQLWVPSALLWLELYGPAHAGTREFVIRLERLAWMLRLAGIDPQIQRTRFLKLLSEIDRTSRVTEMTSLDIERKLLADALQNLRSRTFYYKQYCSAALKRVSVAMGEGRRSRRTALHDRACPAAQPTVAAVVVAHLRQQGAHPRVRQQTRQPDAAQPRAEPGGGVERLAGKTGRARGLEFPLVAARGEGNGMDAGHDRAADGCAHRGVDGGLVASCGVVTAWREVAACFIISPAFFAVCSREDICSSSRRMPRFWSSAALTPTCSRPRRCGARRTGSESSRGT
jgi:hypothetical protein